MKKIRAFTLIELVIALLLSSFTIGLAITAYLMVSKQFNQFTSQMDQNTVLVQFYNALKQDFERADRIYYNAHALEMKREKDKVLSYHFSSEQIVRQFMSVKDTFSLKSKDITFQTYKKTKLVYYFSFFAMIKDKPIALSLRKKYPKYILYTEKSNYEPRFE